jgi:hypothetical protein
LQNREIIDTQPGLKMDQIGQQVLGDGLAGEFPDDCAQFVFFMKTNPMINRPQAVELLVVFRFLDENVAAFAVSVVDNDIEQNDLL